jgi:hypothetical protein
MHRTINTEKDLLIYFNKHLARMRRWGRNYVIYNQDTNHKNTNLCFPKSAFNQIYITRISRFRNKFMLLKIIYTKPRKNTYVWKSHIGIPCKSPCKYKIKR